MAAAMFQHLRGRLTIRAPLLHGFRGQWTGARLGEHRFLQGAAALRHIYERQRDASVRRRRGLRMKSWRAIYS
jgi:hypothetical protein